MRVRTNRVVALVLGLGLLAGGLLVASGRAQTAASAAPPTIGKCQVFPADNPWNLDISKYPVHPNSANFVKGIGADKPLHPDFGTVYQGGAEWDSFRGGEGKSEDGSRALHQLRQR